jgi:hypothetical protein
MGWILFYTVLLVAYVGGWTYSLYHPSQLTFSPGWDRDYQITRFDVEQFLVTAISRDFDTL